MANEAGVSALAAETRRRTDVLHILVNNAGLTWGEPFETYPWKAWERVMSVNVAGLFSLTRDLAPMLFASANAERPSTIINLGSVMGTTTGSETAYAYSASKAAVHHLTRILAQEFAGRQATVNAIAPGPFPTNMTRFAIGDEAGAARGRQNGADGPVGARRRHRRRDPVPRRARRRLYDRRDPACRRRTIGRPAAIDVRRRDMNDWADVKKVPAADLSAMVGRSFLSRWLTVDQERIDAFAKVTEDEQFIHVDPERASATAFGGTVAHGFLTLSLLSTMAYSALPRIEGAVHGVNYGFDRVRFLHPVRSGSRVRGHFTLQAVTARSAREWQLTYEVSVEIEGAHKPALAATWLTMQVMGG